MTGSVVQDELVTCRERLALMEDRWKRTAADLENYRKRADRELERRRQLDRQAVLRDWLEVVDTLERALAHRGSVSAECLWQGIEALYQQATAILGRYDVSRMSTRDGRFDPSCHEAVGRAPGAPEGAILDEVRAGYRLHDDVLRPAQVIVAVGETGEEGAYGI
jgi:molecular chaperone GrpE